MTHQLSHRTPKGWTRRCPELDQGFAERIHNALQPTIAEGTIVDAAIFHDNRGRLRRVDALYESGWIVRARFENDNDNGFVEEFAPKLSFTIRCGEAKDHKACD